MPSSICSTTFESGSGVAVGGTGVAVGGTGVADGVGLGGIAVAVFADSADGEGEFKIGSTVGIAVDVGEGVSVGIMVGVALGSAVGLGVAESGTAAVVGEGLETAGNC